MNKGSERFHELLGELGTLHDQKQKDYGSDEDPFANVRASEEWGIPAWTGALIRLNDKVQRLKSLSKKGYLVNESVDDSLRDIAVYAIISLVLYEESNVAFASEPPVDYARVEDVDVDAVTKLLNDSAFRSLLEEAWVSGF